MADNIPASEHVGMTPGSPYAIAHGCICPRLDNANGQGYMGGAKDKEGKPMFWINQDCPIHAIGNPKTK